MKRLRCKRVFSFNHTSSTYPMCVTLVRYLCRREIDTENGKDNDNVEMYVEEENGDGFNM